MADTISNKALTKTTTQYLDSKKFKGKLISSIVNENLIKGISLPWKRVQLVGMY